MYRVRKGYNILKKEGVCQFTKKLVSGFAGSLTGVILRFSDDPISLLQTYYSLCRKVFPEKYTDANPFKIIWVSPNSIKYEQGLQYNTRDGPTEFAKVVDGGWDKNIIEFNDCFKYESIKNRYRNGVSWEETEYYQRYVEKVKTDPPVYGCVSPSEMEERFRSLDEIYESIKKEGYKTQKELLSEKPTKTWSDSNDGCHPLMNEISVNITRNGVLIYSRSGRNRLCIAKIIGIKKVPVVVRTRHKSWQNVRENIIDGGRIPNQIKGHPDLQDLAYE